jgi:cobalt-zinc-cadmium efflux system membrane fusion protein
MPIRRIAVLAGVLALGVAAYLFITTNDPAGPTAASGPLDYPRGPHGARLLTADGLQLEVTIYETGVDPHFRVYPYDGTGKPLTPSEVTLRVELHRLGGRVDRIAFVPEADYLLGQGVVEEPHSFDVKLAAQRGGRSFDWSYSQIEGKVRLSDATLASTGITIATVGPREMTTVLELTGQIVADDTRVAHVVPRLAGVVVNVARQTGDSVQRGDVLAVIHSRELADARSAYLFAAHHTEFAKAKVLREEGLFKKKISAEQEYLAAKRDAEEAELAETTAAQKLIALGDSKEFLATLDKAPAETLPRFELRAPVGGVVLERDVTTGENVTTERTVFVIGDLSTVWIEAPIGAGEIASVRLGQTATVQSADLGRETSARVSYLSPTLDTATRRGMVRFTLSSAAGWRPGLFVKVRLTQSSQPVAMAVPVEAIQTFRDWQVVFFRFGDWFEARPLTLGRTDGVWVEVLSGLQPGDRYAATNSFAIKAEIGKLGATHDH